MSLAQLLPVLLAAHVALAVALLLPSIVLPFALRSRGPKREPGRITRLFFWLQRSGTLVIGGGLALTGAGMLLILGPQLLGQPWLLVALAIYATNLVLAFFIQRPGLARLLRLRTDTTDAGRDRWRAWARRQRYVSYVMAAFVGLIAFLMSAKPDL